MVQLIGILGLILAAVSLADRRAWPFLFVIVSVWMMTAWSESHPDRLAGLGYRVGFDAVGGAFCLLLVRRPYDRLIVGVFILMLLNHAAFWLTYTNGISIWPYYAWLLNALWLLQLGLLAGPGGRVIVGVVARHYRAWRGLGVSVGGGRSCSADLT